MSRAAVDDSNPSEFVDPAGRYPSPPMSPPPLPSLSASLAPPPIASTRPRPASSSTTPSPSSASHQGSPSQAQQAYYYQQQQQQAQQHQQQQQPSSSSSSQSRKRASHNPSSTSNPPPAESRHVPSYSSGPHKPGDAASMHPAVASYQRDHPRRTLLRFGPYVLLQTLGEGEFGKVKLGVHTDYGEEVAVKLIKRGNLDTELRMSKVTREINVLKDVKHPNIVRLFDVIETDKYIGIILEFANGGELFDHILAHRYLKEDAASKLFAQLISGVHYLHSKNIVHRDLKLENLLLDKGRNVIITDFGFANTFETPQDDLMTTSCGSPCYAAPELVITDGTYVGTAVDIWSCGVILYAMLSGYLPFDDDPANPDGDNINLLYKYILNTTLQFPSHISNSARDLLLRMLVPEPTERATLREVMAHPWLAAHSNLFNRSVEALETISNNDHREKRVQARREMQERLRQAREREAAEQGGARARTRPTIRPGTSAGETSRPWVRPASEMSSTLTMPDVQASPKGLAPPPHGTASSAPDSRSPALDVVDPFAAGTDRRSWIATSTDRDSDFFLEGEARGEPRSRVESAASGTTREREIVPHKADLSTSSPAGSSRQKKQRHTIQVEYDQTVSDTAPSRASSSRSRTTSVLSVSSPKLVSDPSLSPAALSPVHGEIAIILAPASTSPVPPSLVPSTPTQEFPDDNDDEDVKMASPPLPSNSEFPSSPSPTPDSIPIALPTPAPSKILQTPVTPPNEPINLAELNQTPKASARQQQQQDGTINSSPPDTPRAAHSSTESAVVVEHSPASPPPPAKVVASTEMGALPTGSSTPVKSSSGRSRMSIDRFSLGNLLGGRSTSNVNALAEGAGVGSKGVSGLPEVSSSKVEGKNGSAGKKDRRKTFSMMSEPFARSASIKEKPNKTKPTSGITVDASAKEIKSSDQVKSARPGSTSGVPSTPTRATTTNPVFRPTDVNARPSNPTGSIASTSTMGSTGPAKKVMDWFRKKSLAKSTFNDHRAVSPGKTDSFVSVNHPGDTPPRPIRSGTAAPVDPAASSLSETIPQPLPPAVVVTGTGGSPPTLLTQSTAPSSFNPTTSASPSKMLSQYNALISQLPIQFTKAKESGHLNSYPSTTEIVNDNGLDFEIRICPALEAKRAAAKEFESTSVNEDGKPVPSGKRQRTDSDPFEGPYDGNDLYLGKVGQEEDGEKMVGLLNRFSVVDHHFLLVSEEFQSQSSPLHPPHLLHAYLTLMALKNAGQEFIAVYNCGEKSGASQKRRHIQFIPVSNNDEPLVDQWTSGAILARADLPFILPYLPFSHAFARLPPTLSARSSKDPSVITMALLSAHIALLDSIHAAIWSQSDSSSTKATPGESLSYNVILTLQHMVLVPRYREKSELVNGGLSLNSMAFAGMVLTSGEREKEEVKSVGVLKVLASVGYEIVEAKESVEERSMDEGSMAE